MKIGFIGCGNMGRAMLTGIIDSKKLKNENIFVTTNRKESGEKIKADFNIALAENNISLTKECDLIFLAVKPYMYESVINEIKDYVKDDKIIISIAPGLSLEWIESKFVGNVKVVRTMPNTPALIGKGVTAIVFNESITAQEKNMLINIFKSFGETEILDEKLMDGFVALCGSSPAYIYMLIEAMADSAVKMGFQRDVAYRLASLAVSGSAEMVYETGEHPGKLKDMVCSPGGTTIEAVLKLEELGFKTSIAKAMEICREKSAMMAKK